ncbi:MAG: TonB-dependent receptor [Pseudomonadota bacterium]
MNQCEKQANSAGAADPRAWQLRPIAAGCAIFLGVQAGAQAQQAETEAVAPANTVVVSGIRRGIEAAISVKKNSDSIVEAISAEDIGKLPDSSIAESIARLPGVTAQRTAGRASAVSIRGMSPDFSTALLNGREQVSTGDSRGVEFDQYPSELLSGVVIYKTPDGALVGQGLAGTVDMQTVRPLDFPKRAVALNFRREKGGLGTPSTGLGKRASFSYIDQFADRSIGVALGYARLDGNSGATTRFDSYGSGSAQYQGQTVSVPYNGFNAWTDNSTQLRDGAMAVLQFRPNRDFSSTLDLFYSKFTRQKSTAGFQANLNDGGSGSRFDQPGQLVSAVIVNGAAVSGTFNNVRAVIRNDAEKTVDDSRSLGWQSKLRLNADWTAIADLSYNSAHRDGSNVESYAGTTGALDTVSFVAGSHAFKTGLNYADSNVVKLTDVQGWGGVDIQAGYTKQPQVTDRIKAVRLGGQRDLPDGVFFSKVDLGLNLSDRSKRREVPEALLSIKGGDPMGFTTLPGATVVNAGDSGIAILSFDSVANAAALYEFKQKLHPNIFNKDWTVSEKVATAFAKLNIDSKVGTLPLRGALGLQAVNTRQESSAYSVDTGAGSSAATRPTVITTDGKTYTDILPSANLILDLGEQQTLRFGLAKIMARPTMNDMRASSSFAVDTQKGIYSGSGGNPRLDPFRAKGLDLSYERYWDSKAVISLAAFYKKLDTFIIPFTDGNYDFARLITPSTTKLASTIGQYSQPSNGSGGNIKGLEFAASLPLNMAWGALDGFGVVVNGSLTSSAVTIQDTTLANLGQIPLPGLSRRVGALTLYYEKRGFSARIAERYRSSFIGEVIFNTADRNMTYIKGEKVVDLQLGYEFESGPLKGASLLLQVNNLTDAKYVRYNRVETNVVEEAKYGKTVLLGLNYKL